VEGVDVATTRLASFNVENMFARPKAMSRSSAVQSPAVLAAHARFNELVGLETYDEATKDEMLEQLEALGLLRRDQGPYARLRKVRGRFLTRRRSGQTVVVADGRSDWVGWAELTTEPVNELASQHIAYVMRDVGAQVLGVIEAESRSVLAAFSATLLRQVDWTPYDQVMLIDGNDDRGIDVGILVRDGHVITQIRSHAYETDAAGVVFSRDCAEYHVDAGAGNRLVVLVNHLKSKGYGSKGDPLGARRRFRQAARIAMIYNALVAEGHEHVAVVGDLNDHPGGGSLDPLFERTPLRDISEHPEFEWGPRRGTYRGGNEQDKIDYVLLSPGLFARASGGGVFRKGVWRGPRTRDKWPVYDTLTSDVEEASDHAAVYADIDWSR
jgi:endonuclease/exonuclease/phosphatase family metal-dependent hydrolase